MLSKVGRALLLVLLVLLLLLLRSGRGRRWPRRAGAAAAGALLRHLAARDVVKGVKKYKIVRLRREGPQAVVPLQHAQEHVRRPVLRGEAGRQRR